MNLSQLSSQTTTDSGLSRLVPNSTCFLVERWGQGTTYYPERDAGGFGDLLSFTTLEGILGAALLTPDVVRMFRDGGALAPTLYARPERVASHREIFCVDRALVAEQYARGATVLLSLLHRCSPAVGRLCASLARELGFPVHGYAFATPPGGRALAAHVDSEATFVLQVAGRKAWKVYPPSPAFEPDSPMAFLRRTRTARPFEFSSPATELELVPGDVLYMPPGVPHEAQALAAEPSLHINLSVTLEEV